MPLHSALTGADLHEPKGVASATSGQVYVANGSGSGTWTTDHMLNKGTFFHRVTDVSTAETIRIPIPFPLTITRITTVLGGAITVADNVIVVTRNGVDAMGSITVAVSGSAEGVIDSLTPVANNTFVANDFLRIVNGGESTTVTTLGILVEYTRTGA